MGVAPKKVAMMPLSSPGPRATPDCRPAANDPHSPGRSAASFAGFPSTEGQVLKAPALVADSPAARVEPCDPCARSPGSKAVATTTTWKGIVGHEATLKPSHGVAAGPPRPPPPTLADVQCSSLQGQVAALARNGSPAAIGVGEPATSVAEKPTVKDLLALADGFFDAGHYDQAWSSHFEAWKRIAGAEEYAAYGRQYAGQHAQYPACPWRAHLQASHELGPRVESDVFHELASAPGGDAALTLCVQARSLLRNHEDSAGMQACQAALRLRPQLVEARCMLGGIYCSEGREAEALAAFEEILRLCPHHPTALTGRGQLLAGQGKLVEALRAFNHKRKLVPDDTLAISRCCFIYLEMGDLSAALVAIDDAVEKDPDDAGLQYDRAIVLERLRRFDEALQASHRGLQIDSAAGTHGKRFGVEIDSGLVAASVVQAHMLCHDIHWDMGDFSAALVAIGHALELEPDNARFHIQRTRSLHLIGRFYEAFEAANQSVAIDSKCVDAHAIAHAMRAVALYRMQLWPQALEAADRALAIDFDDATSHEVRTKALVKMGHLSEALEAAEQVVRLRPDCAPGHRRQAFILHALNRVYPAYLSLTRSLRIDPDQPDLAIMRAAWLEAFQREHVGLADRYCR